MLKNSLGSLALASAQTGLNAVIDLNSVRSRTKQERKVWVTYKTQKVERNAMWTLLSTMLYPDNEEAKTLFKDLRRQKTVSFRIEEEGQPEQKISFDLSEIDKVLDMLEEHQKTKPTR